MNVHYVFHNKTNIVTITSLDENFFFFQSSKWFEHSMAQHKVRCGSRVNQGFLFRSFQLRHEVQREYFPPEQDQVSATDKRGRDMAIDFVPKITMRQWV